MAYRNGTYVAFDGNATTDPTKGDMKYYGLLQKWNSSNNFELQFSDSHKKTYQVRDSSSEQTLKTRLLERMKNSRNMLIIVSNDTSWDKGLLNWEIEKAVDVYKLPLIVTYTGYDCITNPSALSSKWTKALTERICNCTAKCIHIPFKEKAISSAVLQFSIHSAGNNVLTGPLHFYTKEAYVKWGYIV